MEQNNKKIVIFGGNGFVGTHIAQELQLRGAEVVCISRRGHKPLHLNSEPWSCEVRWCKGDASQPDLDLLKQADVVICSVGSPPLPTFTQDAFDEQYFMNGTTCINAIEGAQEAGVDHVVLMGAHVPWPMRSDKFAYYKGKQDALQAAQEFADSEATRSATVLQPGMITGKRKLENGRTIRLDLLTAPFAKLLPSQFTKVEAIAKCVAEDALSNDLNGFKIIENKSI